MFFRTIMLCCFQKTQRLRAAFGYLHFVVLSTPNTLLTASTGEKANTKHPIALSMLHFLLLHFLCPNANRCVVSAYLMALGVVGGGRWKEWADRRSNTYSHKPTMS